MTDLSSEMQEEIVSIPKELILITLVSQEQELYNPKHENYRNTSCKDGKWEDIANSVGWTGMQCKSKWKAMRDQYCRELKRSKFNAKANVKWKYFRELEFLRPYALSRNYRPRLSVNNNNSNRFNPNNTNIISTATTVNQHSSTNNSSTCSEHTFGQIKIESVPFSSCDFVTAVSTIPTSTTTQIKTENGSRLLTTLTEEQLHSVMQQQQQQTDSNWNYLTATTSTPTTLTTTIGSSSSGGDGNNGVSTQQQQPTSTANDEALYCAIVNCVAAVAAVDIQQGLQEAGPQQQLQQQLTSNNNEEEDDDPIHTFLNIESYFEKELIAMIQQEDVLYNSYHPNYRHVKRKLEVWEDIARKLKKTVKQCRLKWKALRDQYIREHKRLKNRENVESLPRWKHYDALNFLQKFIKHKTNDFDSKNVMQIPKTELDEDMDEQLIGSNSPLHVSPLRSPTLDEALDEHELHVEAVSQLQQPTLPSLTGPHIQQQRQQHQQLEQEFRTQQLHTPNSNETALCVMTSLAGDAGVVVDANDSNAIAGTGAAGSGSGHDSVSGYDEMDIDTYIIGDDPHNGVIGDDDDDDDVVGVAIDGQDEEDEGEEEEEDDIEHENENDDDEVALVENNEDHKSEQHFVHFNHNSNNNNQQASNNVNEQTELEDIKASTHCNADTVQLIVQTQQQQQQQTQQEQALKQQQTQHILNINGVAANISESLQQERSHEQQEMQQTFEVIQAASNSTALLKNCLSNSQQQPLLTETTMQCTEIGCSSNNSNNNNNGSHATPTAGVVAAAAALPAASMPAPTATTDDDEVGAFFKAVAMKIRNAKMSPIAFTDLQIDILRVINGSLRHH